MRFSWTDSSGETRAAHSWAPVDPRAVVACVHGLSGSGSNFSPLAGAIPEVAFHALDLRGQGSDPVEARRGAVLDMKRQRADVRCFVQALKKAHPGKPVFLLGESMGALISAHCAARLDSGVSSEDLVHGVILSVPVVTLRRPVPGPVRVVLRCLGAVVPGLRLPPSRFVNGKSTAPALTRDRAYQDSLARTPHHVKSFTVGFLNELGQVMDSSADAARSLWKRTLVLSAGRDCFVAPEQIAGWFAHIPAVDKTLREYPEAYHLLWHDWDKEQVLEDVRDWILRRAPLHA